MKKLLLLLSVFALCSQGVNAESITAAQAEVIAKQQFSASSAKMTLSYAAMGTRGQADYYVFNRGNNEGFVIVSGDDVAGPVLGYSDKGSFDYNQAPEYLQYLLDEYHNTLQYLRENPQEASSLRNNRSIVVMPICGNAYGECPHWHQFAPYNNYCPTSSSGRCVAGCAPVAFAHIMKGLQYPEYGYGENSYTCVIDGVEKTISSKFSSHSYKYSKMKNGYNETQSAPELSQLIFDCGVAFNTKYSAESSDATYANIVKGIICYFNYNPDVQFTLKQSYTDQNWRDMIYNELDNGRPVYYFGYRTIANNGSQCHIGHAFVVDGYDSDGKVHIIWGFQPEEYNSYFDFTLMSPRIYGNTPYEHDETAEGFNADQGAIIGICRDTTDRGGVVVKAVNLVADTMPANDIRANIELQALSGKYAGTLRYGIVSKNSSGYSTMYSFTTTVDLQDEEVTTIDLSDAYPYLTNGNTYYIVVWSPYFTNSYDWMWFLNEPVPFTVGDWVTPPDPQGLRGDVDGDGKVDITDATMLINYLLTNDAEGINMENANCDLEGGIDISDATSLINYLLNNTWE
ncbi:MAG: C10 family peptidase [Muribaculaceae bacterium]|nr:C10 family peptidase [Muribaculaceae bacterium]